MYSSYPILYSTLLGIVLLCAASSFTPGEGTVQPTVRSSSPHTVSAPPPTLQTADIGLLPRAGGVSLDHVLLALIGAGYGLRQLQRSRQEPGPGDPPEAS